ncbi:hypothetical protein [Parasitella parasitica]|uniref:Uncharacterized protein n=1 Tax=Parasitella parasitica TaxID=35722 RepID=A0A0B7NKP0_9FUNG|nr:hypothetical protein [Parasitella parasitica]
MSSLQDAVNNCVKSCTSSEAGLSADTCKKFCQKASECTDIQCARDIVNQAVNAVVNGTSSSAVNIGLALFFVMFSIYLINFRNNH